MPGKGESASVSGHCSRPLLSLSRRRILGTVYSSTPTREELLKRAKYRFTSAHTANSWVAFFCSPRKRSFTNPNFSFITANTCSTFERTLDFVRFFARSTSSTHACSGSADGCSPGPAARTPGSLRSARDKPDQDPLFHFSDTLT